MSNSSLRQHKDISAQTKMKNYRNVCWSSEKAPNTIRDSKPSENVRQDPLVPAFDLVKGRSWNEDITNNDTFFDKRGRCDGDEPLASHVILAWFKDPLRSAEHCLNTGFVMTGQWQGHGGGGKEATVKKNTKKQHFAKWKGQNVSPESQNSPFSSRSVSEELKMEKMKSKNLVPWDPA